MVTAYSFPALNDAIKSLPFPDSKTQAEVEKLLGAMLAICLQAMFQQYLLKDSGALIGLIKNR